jgi:hypothetical protein
MMVTFFMPNDITFQSNKPNLVITLEGAGGGGGGGGGAPRGGDINKKSKNYTSKNIRCNILVVG